ncbi:hypothetical protein [Kitasatospora fiedleri]|uniref:hypothetical protein n=1 Tax=Kitasatospora fiedleri TaxID=2991545 RepID=UPI002499E8EA|nr:hypothetical protein [Kitasatospora fiedleri]
MQQLGRPELPIRLTISGIIPDPTGGRPPPVLELRFDAAMLADIERQIRELQPLAEPGPAEPSPADAESPLAPLARRSPGEWLHRKLKPEEIEERQGTWADLGASAEKMRAFRDALQRADALT